MSNETLVNVVVAIVAIAFDVFVFVLTMRKTRDHARHMKTLGRVSITQVLFYDGECHKPIKLTVELRHTYLCRLRFYPLPVSFILPESRPNNNVSHSAVGTTQILHTIFNIVSVMAHVPRHYSPHFQI